MRHIFRKPGQSLVEFALVLPIFMMIVMGIIELGILLSVYVGLTNSAREAARAGSVYQETLPVTNTTGSLAMDTRRRLALASVITETLNPIVDPTQLQTTLLYTPTTAASNNLYRDGNTMSVELRYTHSLFFGITKLSPVTIRATSSMRIEPGGVAGTAP